MGGIDLRHVVGAGPSPLHDHGLSRRGFLGLAAGGAALLAAGPLAGRVRAQDGTRPKPLVGGFAGEQGLHVYPVSYKPDDPVSGRAAGPPAVYDQSTITDFKGAFASTDVLGWGRERGNGQRELWFRCDMRLMEGVYIGVDERPRHGTFGFI